MEINLNISDEEVDKLAKDIFENFPEYSAGGCMTCTRYKYEAMEFTFIDEETDHTHILDKEKIRKGMRKFLEAKYRGEFPGILSGIPQDEWMDAGHYDAYDVQAVVQMACFGEVIYG